MLVNVLPPPLHLAIRSDCQAYFNQVFLNDDCSFVNLPAWVEEVCPHPPENYSKINFDLSVTTPGCIKGTLKKCLSKSSPGCDAITYVPSLEKALQCPSFATLFTKTLLFSHCPPPRWCIAKTILIHKKDDASQLCNFRPIAPSSCLGKLFHKIVARRLELYLIRNKIIDTQVQKGFLTGINGVMEQSMQ